MIYLTFNDNPSGIYTSQVIDVVKLLNKTEKTKLIAFVSWQLYKESKKEIKSAYPNSKVYPIVLGISRWKANVVLLKLIKLINKKQNCIARGPLACSLAINTGFKKVCYDGRAAVSAEIDEFQIVQGDKLVGEFKNAEKQSVLDSNFRISVSETLIEFWEKEYGYKKSDHVIIPCTIADSYAGQMGGFSTEELRKQLHIKSEDIVFCFSGGNAGWNSLERTFDFFRPLLKTNANYKIILLTKEAKYIADYINEFPDQVSRYWLKHEEVMNYLSISDYGLLIREDKVTNNVASPVKFAEYLSLGLNVIISDNIKDYAKFVNANNCGVVVSAKLAYGFSKLSKIEKENNRKLANLKLSKKSEEIIGNYNELITELAP